MLLRERLNRFIWVLLVIQIFLNVYPCIAMDSSLLAEENDDMASHNEPYNYDHSSDDAEYIYIEERVLPVRLNNSHDPIKKEINNLLESLYGSSESREQIIPKDDTAFETAMVTYRNWNSTSSQSPYDWDDPILFLNEFDKLFFIHSHFKKTRALQILTSTTFALAPWAMGPLVMYLSDHILDFLPIAGSASYGIVFTVIACATPPCAQQGWEFGRQVGNILFDKNGFLPTISDKKPHIQPVEYPIISRVSSIFGSALRTAPFVLLFWEAEKHHLSYYYSLVGPFAVSLFKRTYDDNMECWNRFSNAQNTKNDHMLSVKKKVLVDSVKKLRTILNFKDGKSDILVDLMYKKIKQNLKRVKLTSTLKKYVEINDPESLINICYELIKEKLQGIEFEDNLREELQCLIERKEPSIIIELGFDFRDEKNYNQLIHSSKDRPLENVLYSYIISKIQEIGLTDSLKRYTLPYNEQNLVNAIYNYMKQQTGAAQYNDSLKKEIEKQVQACFKAYMPKNSARFLQEVYSYIEEKTQSHPLSNSYHDSISLEKSEKSISVFSLLFLKSRRTNFFQGSMEQLSETTKRVFQSKKKIAEEEIDHLSAIEEVTSIQAQEMLNLISDIDKIPARSISKRLLQNAAILLQGMATPGRFLISQWAIENSFTHMGVDPNISFYVGLGAAGIDVLYRIAQEWYLQKDAFSKLRNFKSKNNDFWPIRWFANSCSALNSAFFTLPTY